MPRYDGICPTCGTIEIVKRMNEFWPKKCPKCGGKEFDRVFTTAVAFHPPADAGWEQENGGLGRYLPQAGRVKRPDGTLNPETHARSRAEAIEIFKKRGYPSIERD